MKKQTPVVVTGLGDVHSRLLDLQRQMPEQVAAACHAEAQAILNETKSSPEAARAALVHKLVVAAEHALLPEGTFVRQFLEDPRPKPRRRKS